MTRSTTELYGQFPSRNRNVRNCLYTLSSLEKGAAVLELACNIESGRGIFTGKVLGLWGDCVARLTTRDDFDVSVIDLNSRTSVMPHP